MASSRPRSSWTGTVPIVEHLRVAAEVHARQSEETDGDGQRESDSPSRPAGRAAARPKREPYGARGEDKQGRV